MKLITLKSGSSGNGYILTNGKDTLIIETGVRIAEVKKALNFDLSSIRGAIVSHAHGDHFGYVHDYIKSGIDVYCSKGTAETLLSDHHRIHHVKDGDQVKIGGFTVRPFDVIHDAPEPLGFLIYHPETGTILFLTDSYFSEYRFSGLNNILIETNYDPDILEENIQNGSVHKGRRHRIITSHMSIYTAIDLLKANDLTNVNNIILIHLSSANSHADNFTKKVTEATGKIVTIAEPGKEVVFDKTPF